MTHQRTRMRSGGLVCRRWGRLVVWALLVSAVCLCGWNTGVSGQTEEELYWLTVKDSKNPAELQLYIENYPQGKYVGEARRLLQALQPPPATTPPEPPKLPAPQVVTPPPPPKPLKTWRSPTTGMEFVLIPAGTFQMGSNDSDADADEKPMHTVRLTRPFYLGKYEVTQGQWQTVMGNNPSRFIGNPNRPVENVSWDDVQEFIRRLNAREGGTTYRLPTEAQWEYAARAGTTTRWSFGGDAGQLGRYGWYDGNAGRQTHPVGQLQPNPWGLYDMHGNVWEWVQDWYGSYASGNAVGPAGPSSGSHRVHRGGCWYSSARCCRSALRVYLAPNKRLGDLGFRLLRMAE